MRFFKIFVAIAFSLLSFLACQKNNETVSFLSVDQSENGKIKRIINFDESGKEYHITSYTYDSDKIIQIDKNFTKPLFGTFDERHKISYLQDKVTYIFETDIGGKFAPTGKYEFINQENIPVEYTWFNYDNGQYPESQKVFYEYENSRLTSIRVFFYVSGEFVQKGKIDINYIDGVINDFLIYALNQDDEWILNAKREYSYENGRLLDWVFSIKNEDGNWEDVTKWVFHYSDGMISEIEKLESYFGTWGQSFPPTKYFYDNNKRLIKIISGTAVTIGEYEEGSVDKTYLHLPEDKFFFEPRF